MMTFWRSAKPLASFGSSSGMPSLQQAVDRVVAGVPVSLGHRARGSSTQPPGGTLSSSGPWVLPPNAGHALCGVGATLRGWVGIPARPTLLALSFVLAGAPQWAFASERCSAFDKVVAAGDETPPFASLANWSLPRGQCQITRDEWGHAYVCEWVQSNLEQDFDHHENQAERAEDAAHDMYMDLLDAQDELRDDWDDHGEDIAEYDNNAEELNEFIRELNAILYNNPAAQNHPAYGRAHRSAEETKLRLDRTRAKLEEQEQRLEMEEQRLEAMERDVERSREEAAQLKEEAERMEERIERQVRSEARALVETIRACLTAASIRGSWGPFQSADSGGWRTIRNTGDCPYRRCEMTVDSYMSVSFRALVSNE